MLGVKLVQKIEQKKSFILLWLPDLLIRYITGRNFLAGRGSRSRFLLLRKLTFLFSVIRVGLSVEVREALVCLSFLSHTLASSPLPNLSVCFCNLHTRLCFFQGGTEPNSVKPPVCVPPVCKCWIY